MVTQRGGPERTVATLLQDCGRREEVVRQGVNRRVHSAHVADGPLRAARTLPQGTTHETIGSTQSASAVALAPTATTLPILEGYSPMRAVTRLFQTGITNCPASIGLANATTSRKSSMAEVPPGLFGSEPGNIGSY